MKYGHLERVRVGLTVKSPLFIGSGGKLTGMEFILDRGMVLVPDLSALLTALANDYRRGMLKDFENFLLQPGQRKQLGEFLKRWNYPLDPLPAWVRYTLRAQSGFDGINTLLTFIRDPDGRAYIPGSSIKGALRTALIAARMGEADKSALRRELTTDPKSRRASAVENVLRVLNCNEKRPTDAVNDLLKAVEISDSAPFPAEALTVCRRHWLSEAGDIGDGKSPVFMECLRPGSETGFYLTIDHSLWPDGEDALATLRDALTDWDALIRDAYESAFTFSDAGPMEGVPIVLGGGTGFQRKSLVYKTSDYPEDAAALAHSVLSVQFKTYKPKGARAAPYKFKTARYEGRDCAMGVCDLRF